MVALIGLCILGIGYLGTMPSDVYLRSADFCIFNILQPFGHYDYLKKNKIKNWRKGELSEVRYRDKKCE